MQQPLILKGWISIGERVANGMWSSTRGHTGSSFPFLLYAAHHWFSASAGVRTVTALTRLEERLCPIDLSGSIAECDQHSTPQTIASLPEFEPEAWLERAKPQSSDGWSEVDHGYATGTTYPHSPLPPKFDLTENITFEDSPLSSLAAHLLPGRSTRFDICFNFEAANRELRRLRPRRTPPQCPRSVPKTAKHPNSSMSGLATSTQVTKESLESTKPVHAREQQGRGIENKRHVAMQPNDDPNTYVEGLTRNDANHGWEAWSGQVIFVLYDVKLGEGFHLQKEVLYRAALALHHANARLILSAKQYNTSSRLPDSSLYALPRFVLVLPPWCRVAHWPSTHDASEAAPVAWKTFLDFEWLQKQTLVLDYNEFTTFGRAIGAYDVDLGMMLRFDMTRPIPEGHTHYSSFQECEANPKWYRPPDEHDPYHRLVYSGYCTTLSAEYIGCWKVPMLTSQRAGETLHFIIKAEQEDRTPSNPWPLSSILVKNFESVLVPWPKDLVSANLADALLPNKSIRDEAWRQIETLFPSGRFVAAHVRRSDFVLSRASEVPSLESVSDQLLSFLREHHAEGVFLCTDAASSEIVYLHRYLAAALNLPELAVRRIIQLPQHQPAVNAGVAAMVEVWVATQADAFIGTHESRFSYAIRWDRILAGFSWASSCRSFCRNSQEKCFATNAHFPREHTGRSKERLSFIAARDARRPL